MGTFAGHILPGVFFGFFGLWWSFITSLRFIKSKTRSSPNKENKNSPIGYHSSVTMPCVCLPCSGLRRLPIESFIKIFFCTVGVIGELVTGFHTRLVPKHKVYTTRSHDMHNQPHEHMHKRELMSNMTTNSAPTTTQEMITEIWFLPGNGQHITIYTPFIIGGLIELLRYKKYDIPAKLEWAMGSLAFLVEAYIFGYHLHGKDPLDVHLHILLVYSILGCFVFSCLETFNPREILLTYGRILCTILQATWFIEIAFVVFTPEDRPDLKWDPHDMNQMMIITMSFVWHIFAIIAFLLIQMWSMKFVYYCIKKISPDIDELLLSDELKHEVCVNNIDDIAQMNKKFNRLMSEDESSNEKEKFDSLKLKVKNENTSSGNSSISGHSLRNKSPV